MTPLIRRSALELARAIRCGEISARSVVEAHIERHERFARINAVAANRFSQARTEADAADRVVADAAPDADLPQLLGVPFTVKEAIALAGMPLTAGVVARRGVRAERTAPVVQRVRDAGAIPLGVTNTSELTLWIESTNRVYGRTSNPYDVRRSAGGSSGGEGAAVGCGGSPFGVASDIAGSIRIPACFCGVFGHKPSAGVTPNTGLYPPSSGDAGRMLQCGPLARRAEDLMPLLRLMAGPDGEDCFTREVALGDPTTVSLQGLTVKLVEATSRLPMNREVRGARDRAAQALEIAGAVVESVSLPRWRGALLPYLITLQSGSEHSTSDLLAAEGEPSPTVRALLRRGGPHVLTTRLALALEKLPRPGQAAAQRQLAEARELRTELLETIGDGVLLHPAHLRAVPRHGTTFGQPWLLMPAAIFNLAGVPVTEVPLGLGPAGAPLGIQVAGGIDRDHVTIAVALELERALGGWVPPAAP